MPQQIGLSTTNGQASLEQGFTCPLSKIPYSSGCRSCQLEWNQLNNLCSFFWIKDYLCNTLYFRWWEWTMVHFLQPWIVNCIQVWKRFLQMLPLSSLFPQFGERVQCLSIQLDCCLSERVTTASGLPCHHRCTGWFQTSLSTRTLFTQLWVVNLFR